MPFSGEEASCDSKNVKCVTKLGSKKPDWILFATPEVMGLIKHGTEAVLISLTKSVTSISNRVGGITYAKQQDSTT